MQNSHAYGPDQAEDKVEEQDFKICHLFLKKGMMQRAMATFYLSDGMIWESIEWISAKNEMMKIFSKRTTTNNQQRSWLYVVVLEGAASPSRSCRCRPNFGCNVHVFPTPIFRRLRPVRRPFTIQIIKCCHQHSYNMI